MRKLESIQFVRALAVLLVVGWHVAVKTSVMGYSMNPVFVAGNSGVDVFFVVSGFIMALTINGSGRENFFKKRLVRIIPLYWLVSMIALVAYCISPHLVNSHAAHTTVINSFTLIPVPEHAMLVDVGWTLRYEIIFYFILWLSLSIIPGHPLKMCSFLIITLVMSGFLGKPGFYKDFITNPIQIEFLMGFCAYCIYNNVRCRTNAAGAMLVLAGLFMLLFSGCFNAEYHRVIIFGIPAFFIVAGSSLISLSDGLLSRIGCFIGDSSYSIYLTHMFLLGFALLISKWVGVYGFVLLSFVLSISAGCIFYWLFEKRIIRFMRARLKLSS